MNKTVLFLLIFTMPVYALCPIDSGESVCSLPDFKQNSTQIFQDINSEKNLNDNQTQLQPLQKDDLFNKMRAPNYELMKYDSGCQFGTCVQDLKQNIQGNK
jgi:hypothetical protein